ncbi:MAG TPA: TIGR00296 family protein [Candidatus Bathyarchaeia archaeon]|nr:TIGR00296 family protein [Candidatus Bathyarchaeia archaeon]
MSMEMLTPEDGEALVKLARAAIVAYLSRTALPQASRVSSNLKEPRGVFVTLLDQSYDNGLRGCIGIPFPTRPLVEQVKIAAVEAATADPRFKPIGLDELNNRIALEATVLSIIEPIWVRNPLDLRENITVGRDGLMVEGMGGHGLILPQIAVDEEFDSEEFLSQCCLKADLPPDAWLTGNVTVSRFQGQVFAEQGPNGRVVERSLRPKS